MFEQIRIGLVFYFVIQSECEILPPPARVLRVLRAAHLGMCFGVRDAIVHVGATGAPEGGYYIYKYEASRVDASATAEGASATRACSRALNAGGAQVLPWSSLTWNQADVACRAAGMRLCRVVRSVGGIGSDEWGFACQAGQSCANGAYPYACAYSATACNGSDKNLGGAVACGSLASCAGVDSQGLPIAAGSAASIYTIRGGAFDSFSNGMACDFMGTQLHPTFSYPDTGFRCCSSCPPGQADCSGTCVNPASDSANCGACGVACGSGKTCTNGVCE